MIYPKKIKSKTIDKVFRLVLFILVALSIVLLIINRLTTPNIFWSHLCIFGFIYIYLTVKYSITKSANIASHVVVQTFLLALLMYFIDNRIGYNGWSLNISFPILIIIANITMFVVTIVSHKHFGKYAVSQLIIVLLSFSIVYFIYKSYVNAHLLVNLSILISIINFLLSLILCHKEIKEELTRKFSM